MLYENTVVHCLFMLVNTFTNVNKSNQMTHCKVLPIMYIAQFFVKTKNAESFVWRVGFR